MLYHAFKLLSDSERLEIVGKLMMSAEWQDGVMSASGGAKLIKRNLQLSPASDTYNELKDSIVELLMTEKNIFPTYIYPKKIVNLLFSRTSAGMYYGTHVDEVHVRGGRRDYSFTIFLNNPSDYEGGELVLNIPPESKAIKLNAGSIIIYPTKYLHEVREVSKGERIACVGWIESHIKRDDEREILSYVKIAMGHADNIAKGKGIPEINLVYQRLKKHFGD